MIKTWHRFLKMYYCIRKSKSVIVSFEKKQAKKLNEIICHVFLGAKQNWMLTV